MVEPDQFPLKNGTEVRVIQAFAPDGVLVEDKDLVVPYLKYKDHYRPIATLSNAPTELLAAIAADYMNQQTMIKIPRRPIRSVDEIEMITAGDVQVKQEIKLQALREEDKVIPPPVKAQAPPTMQQILNQAQPRAHSREIQAPWEIAKPELAAREQVLVILELQNAIQEPSTRKAFITRRRDDSWEKAAQRAFGFPIKIDTEVQSVEENQAIPCLANFEEPAPRQLKEGSIHISPRTPLSFPIGIKAVFNDQTADITIQNNTPVARVEAMLSMRWGVQVQFAAGQSMVWAPNKRFEFVSTIPGQRAALTEEMRARLAEETSSHKWRMTFGVVYGWSRYPVDLTVDISMNWDQVIGLWYQRAIMTPGWEVQKYPRDPSAYVMKDVNGNVIEHIDGVTVAFAYYIPSLTGSAQPPVPKKKQPKAPPPPQEKPIALKAVEMSTGDVITLANIAEYGEAIPAVVKMANIPNDWTVTVIENKPTEITVACAPPSYGLITPEKYNELQVRSASHLTAIPKARAVPRAVMVVVTHAHLTPQRKLNRKTLSFRVEEDDDKQVLLDRWITLARNEAHPCDHISRKMSVRATDYELFTGTEDPLHFPWYDCEAITFRDPPRSSTDIRPADSNDPEPGDPPFGPGAEGPKGPQGPNTSDTMPGGPDATGGATDAPKYAPGTVRVHKGDKVDVK
jgi:hypothetical protein